MATSDGVREVSLLSVVVRSSGALGALVVIVFLLQIVASEVGEVVILTTVDATGEPVETRLWVVDLDGRTWLRSGSPQSGWFRRLKANPMIQVERGGQSYGYRGVLVPARRDDVNDLIREKYGWSDAYISLLFGRDDAVPVRLDPVIAPG